MTATRSSKSGTMYRFDHAGHRWTRAPTSLVVAKTRCPSAKAASVPSGSCDFDELPLAQRRVLIAVAWWRSIGVDQPTRIQLSLVSGMKPRSSHFANTISALRTAGWIEYPADGAVAFTARGRDGVCVPEEPATLDDLCERVAEKLSSLQCRIFDTLRRNGEMSRIGLAAAIDQSGRSSHFANTISSLRTAGIVEYPSQGKVALSDVFRQFE